MVIGGDERQWFEQSQLDDHPANIVHCTGENKIRVTESRDQSLCHAALRWFSMVSSSSCLAYAAQLPHSLATPRSSRNSSSVSAPFLAASRICWSVMALQTQTYTKLLQKNRSQGRAMAVRPANSSVAARLHVGLQIVCQADVRDQAVLCLQPVD